MNHPRLSRAVLLALALPCAAAEPAPSPSQSPQQQQQLSEYNRLADRVKQLLQSPDATKHREAVPQLEKMVALHRELFRDDEKKRIPLYEALIEVCAACDDYAAVARWYEEMAKSKEKLLGPQAWVVRKTRLAATEARTIAHLTTEQRQRLVQAQQRDRERIDLAKQGKLDPAVTCAREVLAVRRELLGPRHTLTLNALSNLAWMYEKQKKLTDAESLVQQALAGSRELFGERNPELVPLLSHLIRIVMRQERGEDADRLLHQAAQLCQHNHMASFSPAIAAQCHALAHTCYVRGEYGSAKELLHLAQQLHELSGRRSADAYLLCLIEWTNLHITLSHRVEAEKCLAQAQELLPRLPAGRTQQAARGQILFARGKLHQTMGDPARAEPLFLQARDLLRDVPGSAYAVTLSHLAMLYNQYGKSARSVELYSEVLSLTKRTEGTENLNYILALINLANGYGSVGRLKEAADLLTQAIPLAEKVLGEAHPHYRSLLTSLAGMQMRRGAVSEAESLLEKVLAHHRANNARHTDAYCRVLQALARLDLMHRRPAQAESRLNEALELAEQTIRLTATIQSERQQLLFAHGFRDMLDLYLSLPLDSPPSLTRTYQEVLRWKGMVFARQRQLRQARTTDKDSAQLLDQLQQTMHQLGSLTLAVPADPRQRIDWRRGLQDLTDRREKLEHDLSQRQARSQPEQTPARVQAALPAGAALIDLLEYDHLYLGLPPAAGKIAQARRERRLAAFVLRADGRPLVRLDLGSVQLIADAVRQWRTAFADDGADTDAGPEAPAARLRSLVWEPLQPHLDGIKVVLLSPDGALTRFPFAALPGQSPGRFLLEDLPIALVPVPQLLPEMLAPSNKPGTRTADDLLLVGAVDFDAVAAGPDTLRPARLPRPPTRAGEGLQFGPLPATVREIESIGDSFRLAHPAATVHDLRGASATPAALVRHLAGCRYVHLATHGFFAPPRIRSSLSAPAGRTAATPVLALTEEDPAGLNTPLNQWHPGLLSGLALAGANRPAPDTGILTALEVANLDLHPAELVVLSACSTGLGDVAEGEGVFGLQRAFQVSGARAVVASLWPVDDRVTQQLMSRFYDNLWGHEMSRLEALRQAQLSILYGSSDPSRSRGVGAIDSRESMTVTPRGHPRLWAGWVLSGDPGDLSDVRPALAPPVAEAAEASAAGSRWTWAAALAALGLLALLTGPLVRRVRGRSPSA